MTPAMCAGLDKSSGAFAFVLNFLLLFLSREKVEANPTALLQKNKKSSFILFC
jgi:hypothetical protein